MALASNKRDIKCSYKCFIRILITSDQKSPFLCVLAKNSKSKIDESHMFGSGLFIFVQQSREGQQGSGRGTGILSILVVGKNGQKKCRCVHIGPSVDYNSKTLRQSCGNFPLDILSSHLDIRNTGIFFQWASALNIFFCIASQQLPTLHNYLF